MHISLESFLNDNFKLLQILYDNQVEVKGSTYVNLSQQEIADIAHISKLKANKIINELLSQEYLYLYSNKRGKYALTEKGLKVLQLVRDNNV